MIDAMDNRRYCPLAAPLSLEADAASARGGFACMFWTSDEYERAPRARPLRSAAKPLVASFAKLALFCACTVLMLGTY